MHIQNLILKFKTELVFIKEHLLTCQPKSKYHAIISVNSVFLHVFTYFTLSIYNTTRKVIFQCEK